MMGSSRTHYGIIKCECAGLYATYIFKNIYNSSKPLKELQFVGSGEKPNPNCEDAKTHYVQYVELNAVQLWQTLHFSIH
jgi:hypothetical protein